MPFELRWTDNEDPTADTIEMFIDLLHNAILPSISGPENRKYKIRFLSGIMRGSAKIVAETMADYGDGMKRIEIKPALALSVLAAGVIAKLNEIDIGLEIQREFDILKPVLMRVR